MHTHTHTRTRPHSQCRYVRGWSRNILESSPCLYSTRDHAGTIRAFQLYPSRGSHPKAHHPVFTLTPVAPLRQGLLLKQNRSPRRSTRSHPLPRSMPAPFWFFHSVKTSTHALARSLARRAKISRSIKLARRYPRIPNVTDE